MKNLRPTLLAATLVLLSCQAQSDRIAPADLLEKTAAEHQRLQSLDFIFDLSLTGGSSADVGNVAVQGEGSMQEGGKRVSAAVTVDTTLRDVPVRLLGDVVLQNGRESFFRIRSVLATVGGQAFTLDLPQLEGFLNRWWVLPGVRQDPAGSAEADPSLIPLQLRALDVVKDNGATEQNGQAIRELSVRVNRQRLTQLLEEIGAQRGELPQTDRVETYAAEGELRINETTSLLQQAVWRLRPLTDGEPSLALSVQFLRHGSGSAVLSPEGALPLLSGVSPVTLFLNGVQQGVPDSMEPAQ